MIKQTENQLQYTTSVQQVEFIRSSAISQINAIIEQAKLADAREGGTTETTDVTGSSTGTGSNSSQAEQKPDGQTSVKGECVVSADSLAIREDLLLLLAKGIGGSKKVYVAKSNELHVAMSADKDTNAKAVKVHKTKITLKKGKKFTIKAKLVKENKTKKLVKHTAAYRYYSTNKKIAAVSKKVVVKAKKKV